MIAAKRAVILSHKRYGLTMIVYAPSMTPVGDKPVVFLAGPIQGATTWQFDAAKILCKNSEIVVASPRRDYPITNGLDDKEYAAQVDWETWFLRRAGENGCVLFWIPNADHEIPGRSYAQTTRFELGEWKERAMRKECNLVLGIEDGFPNKRYIARRFSQDCPHVPVVSTLEAVCEQVLLVLA